MSYKKRFLYLEILLRPYQVSDIYQEPLLKAKSPGALWFISIYSFTLDIVGSMEGNWTCSLQGKVGFFGGWFRRLALIRNDAARGWDRLSWGGRRTDCAYLQMNYGRPARRQHCLCQQWISAEGGRAAAAWEGLSNNGFIGVNTVFHCVTSNWASLIKMQGGKCWYFLISWGHGFVPPLAATLQRYFMHELGRV